MIEWGQKSKPKKSLVQKLTPPKKSHAEFPSLKNFQKGLHDITRTTQSALPRILRLFWMLKKILTWIEPHKKKNTCQILLPKQNTGIENSNPKKSFDHPRHLKSGVPLPPGQTYISWKDYNYDVRITLYFPNGRYLWRIFFDSFIFTKLWKTTIEHWENSYHNQCSKESENGLTLHKLLKEH